ncbi:Golgi CORVET complex core vacuolar protein 8-domain-containing protein [Hygrophoropsis aurantiaca]|uniref:Golgi CORVET complex core vacuolar protein 8-domain-containing protein n=1 Tax=Hygrophoropsis aurantiaca TaxID=72124 RepID=A0ACB8AMD5_9AGAM|nr:Golgi CORVET complex core vacuolar protein 8-domain-containing protein [Hygrophoropsis aurantiaca]
MASLATHPSGETMGMLHGSSSENEDDFSEDHHEGDYSTRMEELFDDEDEGEIEEESSEEEGFVYEGVDASPVAGTYRDRLRAVLGPDEGDESEEQEVEHSLLHEVESETSDLNHSTPHAEEPTGDNSSTFFISPSVSATPSRVVSPAPNSILSPLPIQFLHPTVSRLRSYTPQSSRVPPSSSANALHSPGNHEISQFSSHVSDISGISTPSNPTQPALSNGDTGTEREVFRWITLHNAGSHIYKRGPAKASAVLGSPLGGAPMVLAANGLICVGTDAGRILVFDFKQNLICICGTELSVNTVGPVSAVALSNDHTYVASGHITGHIQLFDLKNPGSAARTVIPTSLTAVTSGRQEGHILGSRITSIAFVAGRHTAIVSADETGLSFYHSLGKVLFVEASDTIRILGNYREDDASLEPSPSTGLVVPPFQRRRRRLRHSVLAMQTLPLGPSLHSTDAYQLVALLTPSKLVIVGLKPTPKTWLKRMRNEDTHSPQTKNRRCGALSWFPSVPVETHVQESKKKSNGVDHLPPTHPILTYSWGNTIHLVRVSETKIKQSVASSRTGKVNEVEVGTLVFEEIGGWNTEDDILAIQWLSPSQILVITAADLNVYNVETAKLVERVHFDTTILVSPLYRTSNGAMPYSESILDIAHSIRTYKGKVFLLCREELKVGTLLTWADRILSFVENGDFLSAIELTRSFYVEEAPGNRNGLPDDLRERKAVIGQKMRDLMVASARYAFSEDRMTDGTHVTPDGRGVDRTSLFEGLVATCARACIALDDHDFLFEDLFQQYDDSGISRIFLHQLEAFVLDNNIHYVPPRITQRLVALHEDDGRPDLAERIIWHIDPACLDINQSILLCQTYQLWDALIYVYTRALKDYISPIVELFTLIRQVQQFRIRQTEFQQLHPDEIGVDIATIQPIIDNARKIYPYLVDILSGVTYPSKEPLEAEEAFQAKRAAYSFLFSGRSSTWPAEGGKLILTADEDGGSEPTYPYVRLLLRFAAESFLHSLDIAFEDSYLNDWSQEVNRLVIVKILLDIKSTGNFRPLDTTFINIFIARNVPKYSQFIQIPPSALHDILIDLATPSDLDTREDRQFAAESLLSIYNPHESERILHLFEEAGFYRILRDWHRRERQWAPLLSTYLHDPDLRSSEVFSHVDDVLVNSSRDNSGTVSPDTLEVFSESLPHLLTIDVRLAASLVAKHAPSLHGEALQSLPQSADGDRYVYLNYLLGPPEAEDDEYISSGPRPVSSQVPVSLCNLYISLRCRFHPSNLISVLKYLPADYLDWSEVLQICEQNQVYDAVIWTLNWKGNPREALSKAEAFGEKLTLDIVRGLLSYSNGETEAIDELVRSLQMIGRMGIEICMEHSRASNPGDVPLEDIWFQLLNSQIHSVQSLSGYSAKQAHINSPAGNVDILEEHVHAALRSLVQETFTSLVSVSSTQAVSFPRLFKRLVDPKAHSTPTNGIPYTEFRTILTGMLESYRSDGDMLIISKHLLDRDLFETVEVFTAERTRGWCPSRDVCSACRQNLIGKDQKDATAIAENDKRIVVSRTGAIYHTTCFRQD